MKNSCVIFICVTVFLVFQEVNAVTQCYFCEAPCEDQKIEECNYKPGEYSCYAATVVLPPDNTTISAKACILNDDTSMISECNDINNTEGASCYICDTDLCNDHD